MTNSLTGLSRLWRWQGVSGKLSGSVNSARASGRRTGGMSKNIHMKEISERLSHVSFEGQEPVARRLVLLGFFNRSGSNLLGDYLKGLPGLTGFGESLNHRTVLNRCQSAEIDSFPAYMQSLIDAAGPNSLGLKASGAQVELLHMWNILKMFETVQAVQIIRQDIVSQAVSLWIAKHTKQWTSAQSASMDEESVPYDFHSIFRTMVSIGEHNTRMMSAFSAIGMPVTTVVYERLIECPEAEIRRVAAFLGVDLEGWKLPDETRIAKQESDVKEQFVARARKDLVDGW